jgi:trk system potassium uptake protein TrkA
MKIIICGAGKVGFSIASYLEKSAHDIIVIDQSEELVRSLSEHYDVRAICGIATDPRVLQQAGAEDAEMLIAVTHFDEVNMIACEVANAVFKVPTKIARIRNPAYLSNEWAHLFEDKNISVDVTISPELEVAKAVCRGLAVPGTTGVTTMAEDLVKIIWVKCSSNTPIVNTPITHITSMFPNAQFNIAGIFRDNKLIIPEEKERLMAGDEILFMTSEKELSESMRAFGHFQNSSRRILIIGAGNVGLSLALSLEQNPIKDVQVKIIEKSKERAQEVARQLTNIEVLAGDGLAVEVLREAGVEDTETFVAVTEDDKVNILASLLAKQSGASRAMALIGNPDTIPLVKSLGIDSVVNPREITVSSILRHVRQGSIKSVYTLRDNLGEIIEAQITDKSSLIGSNPHEIDIPNQIKLVAVVRHGEVVLPTASLMIQLYDHLIVIAKRDSVKEVEKMFSARMEYF